MGVQAIKIDLERLKNHPRENQEFHFTSPGDHALLAEIGGKYLDKLQVDVLVAKPENYYLVRGKVKTVLELSCSRCLEKYSYPVEAEFSLNLVEPPCEEDFHQDEDVIFFNHNEADIQPFIEELVFSEIPLVPLCSIDCRGLCPSCGINKNTTHCLCKQEATDPRWDKLKDLS